MAGDSKAPVQLLSILGSTGSIGRSTIEVIALHPERYAVYALSGNCNWKLMLQQVQQLQPKYAVMGDADSAAELETALRQCDVPTEVRCGADAIAEVARAEPVHIVVAGIVGSAGLQSTLAAAGAGKRLLLANKEALVMCGNLLMQTAAESGALVMPTDSEHNAIFQSLPVSAFESGSSADVNGAVVANQEFNGIDTSGIEKIMLTASGGPFHGMTKKQLSVVSMQQALNHPSWTMGPKITVDSASLMNKGLEVIEACYLFGVEPSLIEVLVHPQSVVHSMVRYLDGSVIAQLGRPDMRTPIAHCLAWPERIPSGVAPLNLVEIGQLTFEEPDFEVFPCLRMAYEALQTGDSATTVLNAANEVAVDSFLNGGVSFIQLPEIIERTLEATNMQTADDLETILTADRTARQIANTMVREIS